MSSRLTVVVSQDANRSPLSSDQEETLVAELMMAGGVDATMVGPLHRIDSDDTDFLCLSSFNHSFVIVSPLETSAVREHWQRLGLTGDVVSADASLNGPGGENRGTAKRIYHLHLQPAAEIPAVMHQIMDILKDRSVKTVSIGIGTQPLESQARSLREPVSQGVEGRKSQTPEVGADQAAASSAVDREGAQGNGDAAETGERKPNPVHAPEIEDAEEPEWQHLDRLVEDLDALDL